MIIQDDFSSRVEAEIFAKAWRETAAERAHKDGQPTEDCIVEQVPGEMRWAVTKRFQTD